MNVADRGTTALSPLKLVVNAVALLLTFPLALACGFGRIRPLFTAGGHLCALIPGLPGDYMRTAYCSMTLTSCSLASRISFGAFFSNPDAVVESGVYIGPYSILGRTHIGRGVQIASHVQILSGARQHLRDANGALSGGEHGVFERVTVGAHAWIGAGAIVMANVGDKATVGAGAVVTREVPAGVVAAGNPARVIREAVGSA